MRWLAAAADRRRFRAAAEMLFNSTARTKTVSSFSIGISFEVPALCPFRFTDAPEPRGHVLMLQRSKQGRPLKWLKALGRSPPHCAHRHPNCPPNRLNLGNLLRIGRIN